MHLRIAKTRIKPLAAHDVKPGGKADVEAAILIPEDSSNTSASDDPEYVAVKKLRFDDDTDDDRVLAVSRREFYLHTRSITMVLSNPVLSQWLRSLAY